MKLGILHTKGSFSDMWISYCETNGIAYKLVDCYKNDIIQQLSDCDALMWHFNHKGAKESKFAKQLLFSVQAAGKKVFPDYNTMWHFDDKVGQKYLLEAVNVPMVPSYVFYTQMEGLKWADETSYPKVFKLRNGAGSENVKLVRTKKRAYKLIKKSFGNGFKQYRAWLNLKERFRLYRLGKASLWNLTKGVIRLFYTTEYARQTGREKGYAYFQDFVSANDHDIRVIIIGDKAIAIKRMVRENDFRASGSGLVLYEKEHFEEGTIGLSFKIAEKVKAQCIAFDYVHKNGKPLLIEISYGFYPPVYEDCTGYWDKDLNWHEGKTDPYGWMVKDLINSINNQE